MCQVKANQGHWKRESINSQPLSLNSHQLASQTVSSQKSFTFPAYASDSPETVDDYFLRFKLQLGQRNVPAARHATLLRIHMGPELNSTLNNLCFPTDVGDFSFDEITKKLTDHLVNSKNKYSSAVA